MTTKVPPSHWMTAREQACDVALLGTGKSGQQKKKHKDNKCMLLQQLPVSPLDLSDGGGASPPRRLESLLNAKKSGSSTPPPQKKKNEKKTEQLKLEELREL